MDQQIISPPRSEPIVEVTHDYTAWNKLLDTYMLEINRRGRVDRSLFFLRFAIAGAALIFAIGTSVALILWSLPRNGAVQVVHDPQIVKPEVVRVDTPAAVTPSYGTSLPPAPSPSPTVPDTPEQATTVSDFVMFINRSFGRYTIVTAHKYDTQKDYAVGKLGSEWCYAEVMSEGAKTESVYIYRNRSPVPGWDTALMDAGIAADQLPAVEKLCEIK
jgi:hypothetical protein